MPRKNKAFVIVYTIAILALTMTTMLTLSLIINSKLDSSKKLQALADKINTDASQKAIITRPADLIISSSIVSPGIIFPPAADFEFTQRHRGHRERNSF